MSMHDASRVNCCMLHIHPCIQDVEICTPFYYMSVVYPAAGCYGNLRLQVYITNYIADSSFATNVEHV